MPGTYTLPSNSNAFFYDAGGLVGNYISNMNTVTTIVPENSSDRVSVSFNYFGTYSTGDYLEIHDGNNTTDPLIGTFSGTTAPSTVVASAENNSGALTFKFVSDNYGQFRRLGRRAFSLEGTTSVRRR